MPWAELWLLFVMAEHFKFKILYVPVIPYMADLEVKPRTLGHYLTFLKPLQANFSENHIHYLKEDKFNEKVVFDDVGSVLAQEYANSTYPWVF